MLKVFESCTRREQSRRFSSHFALLNAPRIERSQNLCVEDEKGYFADSWVFDGNHGLGIELTPQRTTASQNTNALRGAIVGDVITVFEVKDDTIIYISTFEMLSFE